MRRAALLFLGLSSPIMLVAFVTGGELGERLFVLLSLLFPSALIILGAAARNRAATAVALVLAGLLLGGGVCLLVLARAESPLVLAGLPVGGWVLLLALGIVPLFLTSIGYALAFSGDRGDAALDADPGEDS